MISWLRNRFRGKNVSSTVSPRFSILALPFFLASCSLLFPVDPGLIANPNFDDPRLTFGTFAAAVRYDKPEIEYKCFSEDFKDRSHIGSLQEYIHARARIVHDSPQVQWVGYMRIEKWSVNPEADAGFVIASFFGRKLLIRMTRHDYAYVSFRDNTWKDFYLPDSVARTILADATRWTVVVESPFLRGVDPKEAVSFQLLPAWKISSFEPAPEGGRN